MPYFPSNSSSGPYGRGRRGRHPLARLAEDANAGDSDALKELMRTIDTKQTGGGFFDFLKDTASDVMDVAGGALDVLSRGQYAVAEPFNRLQSLIEGEDRTAQGGHAENIGDILEGVFSGLTGKSKTSFIDVFEGTESSPVVDLLRKIPLGEEVVGFAADVALDPLTYLGIGPIAKVAKGANYVDEVGKVGGATSKLLGRAAEGSEEALRKGVIDKVTSPVMEVRRGQELGRAAIEEVGGVQEWVKLSRAEKAKVTRRVRRQLQQRDFETAESFMRMERDTMRPELGFKIGIPGSGGRKIEVPIPGLRAGTSLVAQGLGKLPVIRQLSRVLRTDVAYGAGYQQMGRVSEAMNAANFEVATRLFRQGMDEMFGSLGVKKFTDVEERMIAQSLDTGLSTGDDMLDEAAEYMNGWFNRIAGEEQRAGLLKASEVIGHYFPHYYKGEVSEATRRKIKVLRRSRIGRPATQPKQIQDAFGDAGKVGAKIITNLDEVMTRRLGEHFEAMARYNFLSEMTQQFGVRIPTKLTDDGKKIVVGRPNKDKRALIRSQGYKRLSDVWSVETGNMHRYIGNLEDTGQIWVPPETVDALKGLRSIALTDEDALYFGKLHRQVLGAVKSSLTIWNPAFHMRNFRGDVQLNFLDGVKNPRLYGTAARLLEADSHRVLDEVGGLLGSSEKLRKMKIKINDHLTLNGEEFMSLFRNAGAKSGFIAYETGSRGGRGPIRSMTNKLRGASEFREDIPRAAHFLHVLRESKGARSIDELLPKADEAGARVRKFNIDYGDLTDAEKRLKNVFPFYTWFRKNVPLQLEMMFTRPGVQAGYAKAYNLADEIWDPDEETIIPKWVSELTPVQVRKNGLNKFLSAMATPFIPGMGANLIPGQDEVFMTGSSIPLIDALNKTEPLVRLAQGLMEGDVPGAFGSAARSAAKIATDQLSPLITTPLEIGTGRNFFTGAPADSVTEPIAGLFPLARLAGIGQGDQFFDPANGLIGGTLSGDPTKTQQLLNFLAASDLQVVTPERQASELRRREDILDALIRERKGQMGEENYELMKEKNLAGRETQMILDRLLGRA